MRVATVVLLLWLNVIAAVGSFFILDQLQDINYRLQSIIAVTMRSTRSN